MSEHDALTDIAVRWLRRKGCRIVLTEFTALCREIPDAIGWRGTSGASYLVEAKASRSDFLADRNKHFRQNAEMGAGQYRYFICRPGVIHVDDLPAQWGLLYAREKVVTLEHGKDPARWLQDDPFRFGQFSQTTERTLLLSALTRLQIHHGMPAMHDLMHATFASKNARMAG